MLFSGDHVMAWSTPVVAPPDGSMGDYMASLQKLAKRTEPVYFPGHGRAVNNAPRFVAAYILHRKAREASILNRLQKGESDIPTMVTRDLRQPRSAAAQGGRHVGAGASGGSGGARRGRDQRPAVDRRALSAGLSRLRPPWRLRRPCPSLLLLLLLLLPLRRAFGLLAVGGQAVVDVLEQAADARGVGAEIVAAVARGRAHVDRARRRPRAARAARRRRGSP